MPARHLITIALLGATLASTAPAQPDPTTAAGLLDRGRQRAAKGEYDKAIADFDAAIRLAPGDASAYLSRGCAWGQKADWDKAIADFDEAVRLDRKSAWAFYNRGYVLTQTGQWADAVEDFDDAIDLDPRLALAFYHRGRARRALGEGDRAAKDFAEAVRLDPGNAAFRDRGGPGPTREAFLGEVLDARPTPATPTFDAYTPGSYRVEKEDLLKGLVEEAKTRKLTLLAVAVLGPVSIDPLWTVRVVVFIRDGDKVRVNALVMPHARITDKATGLVTAGEFERWRDGVVGAGALERAAEGGKGRPGPFASQLVVVVWDEGGKARELYHGDVAPARDEAKAKKVAESFEAVLEGLTPTYPEKDE